ncbi:MAG: hypothetical protein AAGE92_00555 [Cyanobacteria bacterium P01_G01_bin.4]
MSRPTSRLEQFAEGMLESIEIPIDKITFDPPRQSTAREAVEKLARSICESGITTPIGVYFRIGESTLNASDGFELKEAVDLAKARGWLSQSQAVVVVARLDRELSQQLNTIANRLLSSDATQMVRADCIRELVDLNHPLKSIAEILKTQSSYINRLLALSFATSEIRTAIAQKKLSTTTAMNVLTKHGSTKGAQLLLSAVEAAEQTGQKATGSFVDSYIRQQESRKFLADSNEHESPQPSSEVRTDLSEHLKGADSFSIGIAVHGNREIRSLLDRLLMEGEATQIRLTMHYAQLPEGLAEMLNPKLSVLSLQLHSEESKS